MIVFALLGEDGIVKKTTNCEQCRKDVSLSVPPSFQVVQRADIELGRRCVAHFVPAGSLVQIVRIELQIHLFIATHGGLEYERQHILGEMIY
jgi:hypothetical protein